MRPRNQAARDQLANLLRRRAAASTAELAAQAGVSVATLHRLLLEMGSSVLTTGKARRTRHALRRPLHGDLAALPLYRIDALGRADQIAQMALVYPEGSCLELTGSAWPVPDESRDGWWAGLPYPLHDMRPQGFLGRQLACAEHQALGVAPNPEAWGDDDVVQVLSRAGSDVSGNLILGNPALLQWQARKLAPPPALLPLPASSLGRAYAGLAEQAIAAGVAGSSAAGEFPKFPALRELAGSDTPHVLVKFSGADGSPAVQRWADLLVCEHLALESAATLPGQHSARSRIVQHAGRTFLEVERFDRHGLFGRSALLSLATAAPALLGDGSTDWNHLAGRLHAAGWLGADALPRIAHLVWFGRLIGNSDMHTGNLSFQPVVSAGHTAQAAALHLAPVYDMLPMRYAPLPGGEVPPPDFDPPPPLPAQRAAWLLACAVAIAFWARAAQDARISAGFRALCGANAQRLQTLAARV